MISTSTQHSCRLASNCRTTLFWRHVRAFTRTPITHAFARSGPEKLPRPQARRTATDARPIQGPFACTPALQPFRPAALSADDCPATGWATRSAGNWPVILMDGRALPAIVPENPVLYAWLRLVHAVGAWRLFAALLGHVGAASMHAWIFRDKVFASIACGAGAREKVRTG